MTVQRKPTATGRLALQADTAADLMTPNPVSIRSDATVAEATATLVDHGFTGAPVIDVAGRAIGVVTQADILIHNRNAPAPKCRGGCPSGADRGCRPRTKRRCPLSIPSKTL